MTPEPWSTLHEVAEHLKVSEDSIHRWMATRALPAHRAGKYWRFNLSQVDAWVESGTAASAETGQPGD